MKRVDVFYGGRSYSIGGREPEELMSEIQAVISAGEPGWVTLNDGEGHDRPAHLLITPGVDVAVIPVPGE